MKKQVIAAVLGVIAEIFAPIRRIAQFHICAQQAAHLACQAAQSLHKGKALPPAQRAQPAHFRADAKTIHAPRRGTKGGIMQNKSRIAPIFGARIKHLPPDDLEMMRACLPHKAGHLGIGGICAIRAARLARCKGAGDPPAPGQARLFSRLAPWVGAAITAELLHQDKGVKHHRLAAPPQQPDCLHHRGICRGATINRAAILMRHSPRLRAAKAADLPGHFAPIMVALFNQRAQLALTGPQIIAKPAHHQRHRLTGRRL